MKAPGSYCTSTSWSEIVRGAPTLGSQGRVENAFFRYKSVIGDGLRPRSPAGQGSEVVLGCEILNRMTTLGRPSVVLHRQVRILSVGIVRASHDSCKQCRSPQARLLPAVGGRQREVGPSR